MSALFEKFIESESKVVLPRSLDKYRAIPGYLQSFFPDRPAVAIDEREAEKFYEWLKGRDLAPIILRERLILIRAAWAWGIEQEYLEANPWVDMVARVRVPPEQKPKPFSIEEIEAIIHAFRTDRYYAHYADYVEFLFRTGCRTAGIDRATRSAS